MADFQDHEPDALDSLLRKAQWPEPDDQALDRLRSRWRRARGGPRRYLALALAVAASLALLAAGGWLWFAGTSAKVRRGLADPGYVPASPRPNANSAANAHEPPSASSPGVAENPLPRRLLRSFASITHGADESAALSRPPNAYEALAFVALSRRRPRQTVEAPRKWPELEAAVSQLVGDAKADLTAACQPFASQRARAEAMLLGLIFSSDGPRREAALRMLSRLGSRRSVPALLELRRFAAARAAADGALASLADPLTLARLVQEQSDPAARQALLVGLIRNDARATSLFLNFVGAPRTSSAALAALRDSPQPPVTLLFQALDSPWQSQRAAAAVALGQVDHPLVSAKLIEMARRNDHRQEAFIALLASSSRDASHFLRYARSDENLVASIWAARSQLQHAAAEPK